MTTALVVLYNHNYEGNIPKIRQIYGTRFPLLRQLMPFYSGSDPDVVPVFGNSFQFHAFIAQARTELLRLPADNYLVIADDLLLHPSICADNVAETFRLDTPDTFYIDALNDVAGGIFNRPLVEARRIFPRQAGLRDCAGTIVPDFATTEAILRKRGLLSDTQLSRFRPFYQRFQEPFYGHLRENLIILRKRILNAKAALRFRLFPVRLRYPCVFGYSDILCIPRTRLTEYCRYLEVFATWRMFVELAIPTAMALLPDSRISTAAGLTRHPANLFFPQTPENHAHVTNLVQTLERDAEHCLSKLSDRVFPEDLLYIHPVKLSHWDS